MSSPLPADLGPRTLEMLGHTLLAQLPGPSVRRIPTPTRRLAASSRPRESNAWRRSSPPAADRPWVSGYATARRRREHHPHGHRSDRIRANRGGRTPPRADRPPGRCLVCACRPRTRYVRRVRVDGDRQAIGPATRGLGADTTTTRRRIPRRTSPDGAPSTWLSSWPRRTGRSRTPCTTATERWLRSAEGLAVPHGDTIDPRRVADTAGDEPVARTASRIQGGEGGILEAVVLPDGRNELGQVVANLRQQLDHRGTVGSEGLSPRPD